MNLPFRKLSRVAHSLTLAGHLYTLFFILALSLSISAQLKTIEQNKNSISVDVTRLDNLAKKADLIVVGKVQEVQPSPGYWSGTVPSVQKVNYKVEKLLKGKTEDHNVIVSHFVVRNSLSADRDFPELSRELFTSGEDILLFLKVQKDDKTESEISENIYYSVSENYGALPATNETQQMLHEILHSNIKSSNIKRDQSLSTRQNTSFFTFAPLSKSVRKFCNWIF